jgi:hypothetical protein
LPVANLALAGVKEYFSPVRQAAGEGFGVKKPGFFAKRNPVSLRNRVSQSLTKDEKRSYIPLTG